jgi:RNA polymerase sigma-70 factor (ECF subfamily)
VPHHPAADRIFRELREPVHALCLHVSGRRAGAEEAVRDVFVAVRSELPGFRGVPRLKTWVYRIALRAALQARARSPDGERPEAGTVVDRLPAGPRAVLSLFAVGELSPLEVADVLGVPVEEAWVRLHAARRSLLEALGRGSGPKRGV